MKSYTEKIWVHTEKKIDFVNITKEVERVIENSKIKEGIALINAMHITASVFINDDESGLIGDFKKWLEKMAPTDVKLYNHNLTGEDNAYAHLWRTIMGREVVVAISEGKLDFGPWESIFYGEFDGERKKRILIKIIGE